MDSKLYSLGLALILSAFIIGGCGSTESTATPATGGVGETPAPVQPTQPSEAPVDAPDPDRARDVALAFLSGRYGEQAPALGLTWTDENVTPEGLVGASTFQYASADWAVMVSFPIVAPQATVYQVVVANQVTGFQWEGEINAAGQVVERVGAETPEEAAQPSEIVSLDETWNQYTNHQLGFSIKVPKTMVSFLGSCKWNEENGDHSYRPESAFVPVKIFEDAGSVYIVAEYYHKLAGETTDDSGGGHFFAECNKVTNSLALLQDPDEFHEMWEFVVRDIQNDEELDAFIKSRYGSSCSLGEKTASAQDGVYDVSILGDGKDLEQTQCPLNYWAILKYDPQIGKVIAWNPGQAYTFAAALDYSVVNDQEMIDSFWFLNGTPADPSEPMTSGTEPVDNWWGEIVSNPPGSQFDDYFQRQIAGGGQYGIESLDPDIQAQIVDLRDTGTTVFVWGTLHHDVPDYNAAQIQVTRLELQEAPGPHEITQEPVEGWVGTIEKFPLLAQLDDYFERDDGEQYGIAALDPAIREQIETLRWTGVQVQVWGRLLVGALDAENRQIQVERIEDLSGPATESRNLAVFATPSASSVLSADRWGTYEAFSAIDSSLSTPWTEGVDGPGTGEWIMLTFPSAIELHSIGVDVGYDRDEGDDFHSADLFDKNNRLKRATLIFSDGEQVELTFKDERGVQLMPLARAPIPIETTFIKLVIEEVYPGSTFDDTCVAEIEVWGATK